jgi:hypothetical protein
MIADDRTDGWELVHDRKAHAGTPTCIVLSQQFGFCFTASKDGTIVKCKTYSFGCLSCFVLFGFFGFFLFYYLLSCDCLFILRYVCFVCCYVIFVTLYLLCYVVCYVMLCYVFMFCLFAGLFDL